MHPDDMHLMADYDPPAPTVPDPASTPTDLPVELVDLIADEMVSRGIAEAVASALLSPANREVVLRAEREAWGDDLGGALEYIEWIAGDPGGPRYRWANGVSP